jgi:RHH-type proline utilization regulon transcriptional repressor/proline dehydrogenase/delta 1-pyrroline-5-carboxylate dehydrogenase
VEATRSLRIGPAEDPGCLVGPLIDGDAQRRVLDFIEKGKKESKLAYAADVAELAKEGYFVGPHIFTDVASNAVLAQEEIFGPVLAVLRARDLDHALEIANGTPYALTGGFYSRSPQNIARVKREFVVGNLYINRKITGALVDRQPFGGFKLSGIGSKAGGPDYLLQFLQPRTITENTLRRGFAPQSEVLDQPGL